MGNKSVLMVVAKYPATHGHTTVINNLCIGLGKLGYRTAIGAFSFDKEPPHNIETVKLNKSKLLRCGIEYLGFDIIHSHQSRVNYYLLFRKPTKPVIMHYHGASNKIQEINFKISMWLFKNRITKIISVSNAGISQMKKMIGSVNAQVVYNGVDTSFYNDNLPTPFKKGEPQLLFVSALRKYKNTTALIDLMPKLLEKYSNAHLQIVGTGEDFGKLGNLVKERNLAKNIELTGSISNDELKLRYSSCDLYVSASSFEVCPVPPLEAMACGKPLVLYNIEPHREILDMSNAGVIFTSLDPFEICVKIEEAYQNKAIFSDFATKFAKQHDWSNICKQLSKIYDDLL